MKHFTRSELTRTSCLVVSILEQQANPPPQILSNLDRLVDTLLDPFRELVGRLHTNSGYRCPDLNALQPGASRTSMHMQGLAADLVPQDCSLVEAYEKLAASDLPYDQIIFEYGRWIHVGAAAEGKQPRRQLLMKWDSCGYEVWDPADPRVQR